MLPQPSPFERIMSRTHCTCDYCMLIWALMLKDMQDGPTLERWASHLERAHGWVRDVEEG